MGAKEGSFKAIWELQQQDLDHTSSLHGYSKMVCGEGYGLIHEDLKGLRKTVNRKVKCFNRFNRSLNVLRSLRGDWTTGGSESSSIKYSTNVPGKVSVEDRDTRGSSSTCPTCRSKLAKSPNGQRMWEVCLWGNRHIVAYLNLIRWEGVVRPRPPLGYSCETSPNEAHGEPMRGRRGAKGGR